MAHEFEANECRDRLTSLEAPVVLRFRRTSASWSAIVVLSVSSMVCFVFGIAYMLFLSDDAEILDRGGVFLSVSMRVMLVVFFFIMVACALALSCLLAQMTNFTNALLKRFETPRVMHASAVLWGGPHAFSAHLHHLELNMRVMDTEFSLSTVFKIVCYTAGSIFFVILGAMLAK